MCRTPATDAGDPLDTRPMRDAMVSQVDTEWRRTCREIGCEPISARVLDAMRRVARDEFVPEEEKPYAHENRPLPIGEGQTISQPLIVAVMTDLARLSPDAVVLEVGTGSGYQAAMLAELARHVYTIEIVRSLGERAAERLRRLGYRNVSTRIGDGYLGWPEHAPFDAIVVTAAAPELPAPLLDQLKPGGRLVIPVGHELFDQELLVVEKSPDGSTTSRSVVPVRFVPLTGEGARER